METIKEFVKRDRFASHCGIQLLEVSQGSARAKMHIQNHQLNGLGLVQGGAIFTLADLAFAAASNSHGTVAVAINASISFLKGATKGALFADARQVAINPKLASYNIDVTDDAGEMIAVFQGMVYRKKDKIER